MYRFINFHKDHLNKITIPKEFVLPDVGSPLLFIRGTVIDDDGQVVAVGFIKLIGEAILIMDENVPNKDKADVITVLTEMGANAARAKGLDEINVFVTRNKSFVNFLSNKMGFVKTGAETLVKRLWE